ncbi:hypothetical protein KSP39_PZI015238 [Platanthera zijinensis]|uniref:Uncharacterized protein n=1 Tax=Platanthera zijinensis TaxID=2320716 RepID=A0AAP0G1Q5_9ASPA
MVMAFMRANNRQGASHRNGLRTVLKARDSVENAGVVEFFFGKDGNERLKHDKFVAFLKDLQEEILRLEFDHYDVKSEGEIFATDFALSMVASANINHINKFLDRVDVLGNDPHLKDIRISFEIVLRKYLHLLSFAIFSFGEANGFLAKEDFMRASSQVFPLSLPSSSSTGLATVVKLNEEKSSVKVVAEKIFRADDNQYILFPFSFKENAGKNTRFYAVRSSGREDFWLATGSPKGVTRPSRCTAVVFGI